MATLDYDVGTPGDPIIFNVVPLNPGGYYDVTTGIYTVPLDGVYEFILHIWSINDAAFGAWIVIDDVLVSNNLANILCSISVLLNHRKDFIYVL